MIIDELILSRLFHYICLFLHFFIVFVSVLTYICVTTILVACKRGHRLLCQQFRPRLLCSHLSRQNWTICWRVDFWRKLCNDPRQDCQNDSKLHTNRRQTFCLPFQVQIAFGQQNRSDSDYWRENRQNRTAFSIQTSLTDYDWIFSSERPKREEIYKFPSFSKHLHAFCTCHSTIDHCRSKFLPCWKSLDNRTDLLCLNFGVYNWYPSCSNLSPTHQVSLQVKYLLVGLTSNSEPDASPFHRSFFR